MAKSFDILAKRTTTAKVRAKAAKRARHLLGEMLLAEVRRTTGKSQRELAGALGIKQPSLSKLEGQADMQISTLRKLVEAMGGDLHITATFPAGDVVLAQFDGR